MCPGPVRSVWPVRRPACPGLSRCRLGTSSEVRPLDSARPSLRSCGLWVEPATGGGAQTAGCKLQYPDKHTNLSGCRSPACPACCRSSPAHSSAAADPQSRLGAADRPGVHMVSCRRTGPPSTSLPRSPVRRTRKQLRTRAGACWPVYQAARRTLRSPSSPPSLLSEPLSKQTPPPTRPAEAGSWPRPHCAASAAFKKTQTFHIINTCEIITTGMTVV